MILIIKDKLENQQWSPEQINGYCNQNNIPMVSHERIYQYIVLVQREQEFRINKLREKSH
jgi:IS30 family transposase